MKILKKIMKWFMYGVLGVLVLIGIVEGAILFKRHGDSAKRDEICAELSPGQVLDIKKFIASHRPDAKPRFESADGSGAFAGEKFTGTLILTTGFPLWLFECRIGLESNVVTQISRTGEE